MVAFIPALIYSALAAGATTGAGGGISNLITEIRKPGPTGWTPQQYFTEFGEGFTQPYKDIYKWFTGNEWGSGSPEASAETPAGPGGLLPPPTGGGNIGALPGIGGSGGGGGGGGISGAIAASQQQLQALLKFINETGDSGIAVVRALADETAKGAKKEEKRIRTEYTPQRVEETEQRFIGAAEDIAAREAEIAAAAGDPEGRAGVYVAPGGTQDWEMLMRAKAPIEGQYVSDLGNISADTARSYAMAARTEGLSYVGALKNLVLSLSTQAVMDAQSREAELLARQASMSGSGSGKPTTSGFGFMSDISQILGNGIYDPATVVEIMRGGGWNITLDQAAAAIQYILSASSSGAAALDPELGGTFTPPTYPFTRAPSGSTGSGNRYQ